MALIFKRILLVTYNVKFAIDIKRSLELVGDYEVTTATDADTALERLRDQRHNLVILDIENLSVPPPEMITLIRKTQNEIAIVLAPDTSDTHDIAFTADVQGVVDIPMSTRQLIPIIESSVRDVFDNLPETAKAPAVSVHEETRFIETLVDELLGGDETPYFTSRQVRAQKLDRDLPETGDFESAVTEPHAIELLIQSSSEGDTMRYVTQQGDDRAMRLFQKLANEEPPMPGIKDSGTVSDLARSATRSQLLRMLKANDDEEETEVQSPPDDEADTRSQPAILVLQVALEETTPVHAISIDTLIENVQNRLPEDKQNIRPLPSWLKESKKFVTEPIFLKEDLPSLDSQRPIEYTSTLTQPSDSSLVVRNAGDLDTEVIESDVLYSVEDVDDVIDISDLEDDMDSVDISDLEDDVDSVDISGLPEFDEADEDSTNFAHPNDEEDVEETIEELDDALPEAEESEDIVPVDEPDRASEEDPYITQLAVTLTQMTTELAAEATILTRDNDIVAYSGEMPIEDIEDIRGEIREDWRASGEDARIRFITLPSSGRDYMLYSKATVGGFTLSMLFAGTKQLRVIRRQGERLIGALDAIPDGSTEVESLPDVSATLPEIPDVIEPVDEPEVDVEDSQPSQPVRPIPTFDEPDDSDEEPIDVGPKEPYTFIWMVESFEVQLSEHVAKQLVFWLEVQLNSMHWTIHKLEVHQDFVYLYADIPGEVTPSELIRSLIERSEKIVKSEDESLPEKLWADAYLVLTPGRELTEREIQRFLNFGRGEM